MISSGITGWGIVQNNDFFLSSLTLTSQQEDSTLTVTSPLNLGTSEMLWDPSRSFGLWVSTDSQIIPVHEIPFDKDHKLVRANPIILDVRRSECGQYLTVDSGDLDTSLSEESIEDLIDTFKTILALTWEVFAMGDPNEMDKGALEIRERLLATYRLVPII